MRKEKIFCCTLLIAALLLSGCTVRTLDEMYQLPRRSESDDHLQSVIDEAMGNLDYSSPIAGENQQTVQTSDLTGDNIPEYIVFARDSANKALQILVFAQREDTVDLMCVIETHGASFEQVEYVEIDDKPGLEMVVGRRLSDQLLRSVTVYSFENGTPGQLMTTSCLKFLTCDLDRNGYSELMLIQPGQTDADRGVAVLYQAGEQGLERSHEVALSASADSVKRIMLSRLQQGEPAVYVASSLDENAVITDIFALCDGRFSNISYSADLGTSVQTLRNYYVYADDIDTDGVLELPDLITMRPIRNSTSAQEQYLIRWYSMSLEGQKQVKRHTFHNYDGGWYLELGQSWAERISVIQNGSTFWFYIWDEAFEQASPAFSVYVLTGPDREEQLEQDNRFVLLRAEGVIYAAKLETGAADHKITQEDLTPCFHLIHQAWKTGET